MIEGSAVVGRVRTYLLPPLGEVLVREVDVPQRERCGHGCGCGRRCGCGCGCRCGHEPPPVRVRYAARKPRGQIDDDSAGGHAEWPGTVRNGRGHALLHYHNREMKFF